LTLNIRKQRGAAWYGTYIPTLIHPPTDPCPAPKIILIPKKRLCIFANKQNASLPSILTLGIADAPCQD
jgi:hypothetical protein